MTRPSGDRPRRRRLDAAKRRESILDVAIPLFAQTGFEHTRVADIATRVGVTEPVVFQNFGTKVGLFAAALERASDQAARHLAELAASTPNVHDWLRSLLAAEHLDYLHTAPMFGVLFADAHHLQAADAGLHAALHRSVVHSAEALAGILERGQTQGSIRADAPPLTLAWLVVSLIQARQFRRSHTPEPSPRLETDLLNAVLDALAPPTRLVTLER